MLQSNIYPLNVSVSSSKSPNITQLKANDVANLDLMSDVLGLQQSHQ